MKKQTCGWGSAWGPVCRVATWVSHLGPLSLQDGNGSRSPCPPPPSPPWVAALGQGLEAGQPLTLPRGENHRSRQSVADRGRLVPLRLQQERVGQNRSFAPRHS